MDPAATPSRHFVNALAQHRTFWSTTLLILFTGLGAVSFYAGAYRPYLQGIPLTQDPAFPLFLFTLLLVALLAATYAFLQTYYHAITVRKRNDEQKTAFVRMAADTIRTPITGLRWLTELYLSGELGTVSDHQKESIKNMETAIGRLVRQVDELLTVMKMSGGILHYRARPADVTALLKNAAEDLRPVASGKFQRIGFGQISTDVPMSVDEPLVRHLLGSLLGGAIRLADLESTIVLHAEPVEGELNVGITYTGAPIDIPAPDSSAPKDVPPLPLHIGDVDLTVSWEILFAAQGRFWVRDRAPEHTFFVGLPYTPAPMPQG